MEKIETVIPEKELRIFRAAKPVRIEPLSDVRIAELDKALAMNTKTDPEEKKDPINGISILELMTSDLNEILFRQQVSRWLMVPGMEEFAWALNNVYDDRATLPKCDVGFIEYYHDLLRDSTNFWLRVNAFTEGVGPVKGADKENLPPRIREILNEIEVNGPIFRSMEKTLAKQIIDNMRSMVAIEGIVDFAIDTSNWRNGNDVIDPKKTDDKFCFGIRQYDENLDKPQKTIGLPLWTGWAGRKVEDIVNGLMWENKHRPSRIKKTPASIIEDIGNYLNAIFKENRSVSDSEISSLTVRVAYQLGLNGLTVQIISWSIGTKVIGTAYEVKESSIDHPDFKDDRDNPMVKKFAEKLAGARTSLVSTRKWSSVNNWFTKISERIGVIDSSRSSKEFCLAHFKKVYAKYEEQIEEIKDWQAMIERAFDDIILLNNIIERMSYVEVPCSLPEFVSDGTFQFKDIYPLRLASIQGNILAFDKFSVNGKVANLTGRNGSGKTTLQISVLDAIIMAMCGLPVPVMEMKLPLTKVILLSFLDRELNRSTFQAKMHKDTLNAKIIGEMSEEDRQQAILIIDEVGSATTQESVLPLVQQYIKWINLKKISVVMSTQIPELSKYIKAELKGTNLIIKLEEEKKIYEISEGIGEGEPVALAREAGLLDIINKQ